ncbi:MAG: hypothetical protein WD648_06965 [Planctomycetaceae bacterium]
MTDTIRDIEIYRKGDEIIRMFRTAVRKAQEESRRLGVPNVYSFNGQIYYELPNGDFVRELPEEFKFDPLPPHQNRSTDVTSTPES